MSLFTEIVRQLAGSDPDSAQRQSKGLAEGLLDMLQDDSTGGIEGIRNRTQRQGLGEIVSSWIGTGRERVEALSQRAGIPASQGANVLSRFLPELLDKLTPEGDVPQKRHYGDASQWPRIFEANRGVLRNPDLIYPGQVLRIP